MPAIESSTSWEVARINGCWVCGFCILGIWVLLILDSGDLGVRVWEFGIVDFGFRGFWIPGTWILGLWIWESGFGLFGIVDFGFWEFGVCWLCGFSILGLWIQIFGLFGLGIQLVGREWGMRGEAGGGRLVQKPLSMSPYEQTQHLGLLGISLGPIGGLR